MREFDARIFANSGCDPRHAAPQPTHYYWPAIVARRPPLPPTTDDSSDCCASSTASRKRKALPIPVESKDDAYWERRKKNNESAKRSREMRRLKEQQTCSRVVYLEHENLKLRAEVETLREEIGKLRALFFERRSSTREQLD